MTAPEGFEGEFKMMALVRGVISCSMAARGDAEIFCLVSFEEHGSATGKLDDVFEGNPVGHRQNNFIAVVNKNIDGLKQGQLAAGGEDRLVGRVIRSKICRVALDDGLAQLRNAADRGVAREVAFDGGDGGVLDVTRRGKVRFARSKIHQVDTLGTQLGCLCSHGHGRGNFNPVDAIGEDFLGN